MEQNEMKRTSNNVFKRLETKIRTIRLKGGEIVMKKILTILTIVAMVFSLAMVRMPNVSAADFGMHITSHTSSVTTVGTSFGVYGTFDAPTSGSFKLKVEVGTDSHEYSFNISTPSLSWGPVTVSMSDFPSMSAGNTYTASLKAYSVTNPNLFTGQVNINWAVGGSLDRMTSKSGYTYIDPYPGPTGALSQADTTQRLVKTSSDKIPIYTMGEYIDGTAVSKTGTVQLRTISTYDGQAAPIVVQQTNIAGNRFRIPTDNVKYDGVYEVYDATAGQVIGYVFIKYNISIDQTSLDYCKYNFISGYIKHGDGTGAAGAAVVVLYPNGDYLVYATVDTHGQFSVTIGANASNQFERGVYSIAVVDNYPVAANNLPQDSTATAANNVDALVYKQLYTATLTWKLDTFVDPTILYENAAGEQSFVLKLFDETGAPVTGEAANFTLTGFTETPGFGPVEISPGFYLFVGTVNSGANFVTVKVMDTIGGVDVSASKVLQVTKLTEWNPQVVVDSYYSISPYGEGPYCYLGRDVYDKLPCTVGNSLEIYGILYKPADEAHYQIHDWTLKVNGPVTKISSAAYLIDHTISNSKIYDESGNRYIVNAAGKISVHFEGTIWQMADYSCNTFAEGLNVCCLPLKTADFNICENQTCTVDSVTTVKNTDGTYDIKIAVSGDPTNLVDCAICDQIAVHIYTIDTLNDCLPNGDLDLWYNPIASNANPDGTHIDDLPIAFGETNVDFVRDGNTIILKGVDLSGLCADKFIVQVFGTKKLSQCAGSEIIHPLVYEKPLTINLYNIKTLNATADTTTLVAGVCTTVTISGAKFTLGDPTWIFYFDGVKMNPQPGYSIINMGSGVWKLVIDPAISDIGTLEIMGIAVNGCDEEFVDIKFDVKSPIFEVKLGLKDGSVIDNDHIITEGFEEKIYVTAKDPITEKELTIQDSKVEAVLCDCDIPSSVVDSSHPSGCEGCMPIAVIGLDNPNIACDPQFELYVKLCNAWVLVDTFTLKPAQISANPTKDIPWYSGCINCAKGTDITFGVIDAHNHGVPNTAISILDSNSVYFGNAYTGPDGKVIFTLIPTYQGNYYVTLGTANGYVAGDIEAHGMQFGEFYCGYFVIGTGNTVSPCDCVFNNWVKHLTVNTTQTLTTIKKEDKLPPTLEVTAPEEVTTPTVKVTGKATDEDGVVASVWVGAKQLTLSPNGTFETVLELVPGENTFTFAAFDGAGHKTEQVVKITYTKPVDTTAPTITITEPADGTTFSAPSIVVKGSVTDDVGVASAFLNDVTVIPLKPDGTFAVPLTLAEGSNVIKVTAFDAAGNKAEAEVTVTYEKPQPPKDTTAPTITITEPADGATFSASSIVVKGSVTDDVGVASVYLNDVIAVVVKPDGTFAVPLTLAEGSNVIKVTAFDAAGNKAEVKVTVTYKPTPPPVVTKIVLTIGSDIMMVNGKAVQLDAAPEIVDGRTFLPLRAIAEAFGAQVTWVPETKGITVVLGDTQIGLQIGNNTAVVNGNVISIVPPYIKNGRTMVPFRVISEAFGADVQWDSVNRIVTVVLQG